MPEVKSEHIGTRITKDQLEEIEKILKRKDIRKAEWVRDAVLLYMEGSHEFNKKIKSGNY